MVMSETFRAGPGPAKVVPSEPGGLLDVLSVAAVVLDTDGRITLWSPQAQDLFGWSAEEALGSYAAKLLVVEEYVDLVLELFGKVMAGGGAWAGVFPVRRKDGSTRLVEFRNMRLQDEHGAVYALGIACDEAVLRGVERDLALSVPLVAQSPLGLAVLDTDLRYVLVNPTLQRINGLPAESHLGRTPGEALPFLDTDAIEAAMRQVLDTGVPLLDQYGTGRTPADPDQEHAWSGSYYRLEDPRGRVIGVALMVVDVTDSYRAAKEAAEARRRLDVIARASVTVGTTLDLERTARELAHLAVTDLADIASVDVLDSVLEGSVATAPGPRTGQALFMALAVATAYETASVRVTDPVGERITYPAERLVTRCVSTGRPVLVSHVTGADLAHIARDAAAADLLAHEGAHSYLAVPLTARGQVLGALGLLRTRNPLPFDHDDVTLAGELATRAAIAIDNARWYQHATDTALTLQRHLLPHPRPGPPAYRSPTATSPRQLPAASAATGSTRSPSHGTRPLSWSATSWGTVSTPPPPWDNCARPPVPWRTSASTRPGCCATSTTSPPSCTGPSRPASTPPGTRTAPAAASPSPATRPPSSSGRGRPPACSPSPPACRWARETSAVQASRTPSSTCSPGTGWSSTPTASSKPATTPWTTASTCSCACSPIPASRRRRPATGSWPHCDTTTRPTTSPSSSPMYDPTRPRPRRRPRLRGRTDPPTGRLRSADGVRS